ncbi:MAG: ATP synthase F1 subunit delta [Bacteroidetes bacterium]|nr:ATP synthase F1 subunit delta [Bacteroidota bacterium]
MYHSRIAKRYAEALLLSASNEKSLETLMQDCLTVKGVSVESHEFRLFLKSPIIKKEKKLLIMKQLFHGKVSETMEQFLILVVEKGRESMLLDIFDEFVRLTNEQKGIVDVEVQTAVPLSKEHETRLIQYFNAYTNKNVQLKTILNPSIIGGLIVRIGDTVFDGSVRHQLELLRMHFTGGST